MRQLETRAWCGQMWSFTPFPTSGRVYFWKEAYDSEYLVPIEKHGGRFCDGLGSNIVALYPVSPIITLHDRITARQYVDRLGNKCILWSRRYSRTTMQFTKRRQCPLQTTGTVLSWFAGHEGELQHLPSPAESPDLNIIEPLWSVLETRMRNKFPPWISLK
jgi:hypothetical protein